MFASTSISAAAPMLALALAPRRQPQSLRDLLCITSLSASRVSFSSAGGVFSLYLVRGGGTSRRGERVEFNQPGAKIAHGRTDGAADGGGAADQRRKTSAHVLISREEVGGGPGVVVTEAKVEREKLLIRR